MAEQRLVSGRARPCYLRLTEQGITVCFTGRGLSGVSHLHSAVLFAEQIGTLSFVPPKSTWLILSEARLAGEPVFLRLHCGVLSEEVRGLLDSE